MIKFKIENDEIFLIYSSDDSPEWILDKFEKNEIAVIGSVFHFSSDDLISKDDYELKFKLAIKKNEYFFITSELLDIDYNVYINTSRKIEIKIFRAPRNISIFRKISQLVTEDIYIGGDNENSIPIDDFNKLLKSFPNSYEFDRYTEARISSILSSYVDLKKNYENNFQKYMNKKYTLEGDYLFGGFAEFETYKYEAVLSKLKLMLENQVSYNESRWQKEILEILLLIYPKYLYVMKEAPVIDYYTNKNRSVDFLLIDFEGNTDIVEIKKPFDNCIVTKRKYRDNYIPLRELSGTIMQVEKYIFYLNKSGLKGEKALNDNFKKKTNKNINIRVTNPNAYIIMGRTKGMNNDQIQDFEIIKRKYKNVIDIITYDDLIQRLEIIISRWKGVTSNSLMKDVGLKP